MIDVVDSQLRLTVAQFTKESVFVHAGVVAWKEKAILIPAPSFRGKSALTAALVKLGAIYYSDEYAVLDDSGFVHPFAKPLSIRGEIDDFTQVDYAVEDLGGSAGAVAIPVGMVLITEFKPNGRWTPRRLSPANGIVEMIKNTIPIRDNTAKALKVLNQVAKSEAFMKSSRGDDTKNADVIVSFFEN